MKSIVTLFLLIFFSCAPKPQAYITITQAQLDNPTIDTSAMPVLNARCPYNDSTSAKPVPVKAYNRKNGTAVAAHKRGLPARS